MRRRFRSAPALLALGMLALAFPARAEKQKGLAPTPPMGWNSWNHFQCDIDEATVRKAADAMVDTGMKAAGYQYVNIDDCWQGERDGQGNIQADPKRFPSGIKALADYVHDKGLKLGIYSDAGFQTCAGRPGSRGYEFQDARTYAQWGVDYLKYDWCNTEGLKEQGAYLTMREALANAGRRIVFSLCEWGNSKPWEWGKDIGHLWRTTGDIAPCFDCVVDHGTWKSWGVLQILDKQHGLRKYSGPDHWNDPDMLEVGNGMSVLEDQAHFSLWALLAAPLLAGNDLTKMTPETRTTLTNVEVIAIDQDPLGISGFRALRLGRDIDVWVKPLAQGKFAVGVLNRSREPATLDFDWKQHDLNDSLSGRKLEAARTTYAMRDVWAHQDIGATDRPTRFTLQGHQIALLRLSPTRNPKGAGKK